MVTACYEPAPYALHVTRAEGAWVFDALGRRYLDLQTSHAALNFGHRHPKLVAAAKNQLGRLHRTSFLLPAAPMAKLAADLATLCGAEASHLLTSRLEALQHVGRAVRFHQAQRPPRPGATSPLPLLLCVPPGERTTSQEQLAEGFGGPLRTVAWDDLAAVQKALMDGAAAVLLEPMLVRPHLQVAQPGYLAGVAAACNAAGVPLIVDESTSGLGRFGPLLLANHAHVSADLLVLGHALGGGIVPITAVVGKAALLDPVAPHAQGSPLAGNALACSIAQATLDLLADGELVRRGQAMGQRLREGLHAADLSGVAAISGQGLWLGIELQAALGPARPFCERLLLQGVLTIDAGGSMLQVAPPLVIEPREVDWALERLVEVLSVPLP